MKKTYSTNKTKNKTGEKGYFSLFPCFYLMFLFLSPLRNGPISYQKYVRYLNQAIPTNPDWLKNLSEESPSIQAFHLLNQSKLNQDIETKTEIQKTKSLISLMNTIFKSFKFSSRRFSLLLASWCR